MNCNDMEVNMTDHPRKEDILCGRAGIGSVIFEHAGNKRFRSIVATYKVRSVTCNEVYDKLSNKCYSVPFSS